MKQKLNEVIDLTLHANQVYDNKTGKTVVMTLFFNPYDKIGITDGTGEDGAFKRKNYRADDIDFDYEGITTPVMERVNDIMNAQAEQDKANGYSVASDGTVYDGEGNVVAGKGDSMTKEATMVSKGTVALFRKIAESYNNMVGYWQGVESTVMGYKIWKRNTIEKAMSGSNDGDLASLNDMLSVYEERMNDAYMKISESIRLSSEINELERKMKWHSDAGHYEDTLDKVGESIREKNEELKRLMRGKTPEQLASEIEQTKNDIAQFLNDDNTPQACHDNSNKQFDKYGNEDKPTPLSEINKIDGSTKISSKFKYMVHPSRLVWELHIGNVTGGVLNRLWDYYVTNRLVPIAFRHIQLIANSGAVQRIGGEDAVQAIDRAGRTVGSAFADLIAASKKVEEIGYGISAKDVLKDMMDDGVNASEIKDEQIQGIHDKVDQLKDGVSGVYERMAEAYQKAKKGDYSDFRSLMKNGMLNETNVYSEINQELIRAQNNGSLVEVKSKTQWAKEGRYVKPGEIPMGLIVPTHAGRVSKEKSKEIADEINGTFKSNLSKMNQPKTSANDQYKQQNLGKMGGGEMKSYINRKEYIDGRFMIKFTFYKEEQTAPLYGEDSPLSGLTNNDDIYMDGDEFIKDKYGRYLRPSGANAAGTPRTPKELEDFNNRRMKGFEEWCESIGMQQPFSAAKSHNKENPIDAMKVILRKVAKDWLKEAYGENIGEILGAKSTAYITNQSREICANIMDAIGYEGVDEDGKDLLLMPKSEEDNEFDMEVDGRFGGTYRKKKLEAVLDTMRNVAHKIYRELSYYLAKNLGKRENMYGEKRKRKDESLYAGLFDGKERLDEEFKLPSVEEVCSKYAYIPESKIKACENRLNAKKSFWKTLDRISGNGK